MSHQCVPAALSRPWPTRLEQYAYDHANLARMAVLGQGADCRPDGAVHRTGDTTGQPVLGDGLRICRVAPVVRRDTLEGDLPSPGHAARRRRVGRAAASLCPAADHAEPDDVAVDRRPALPLAAGSLAAQLHLSAGGLHGAADQPGRGQSSRDHLRCRARALRGNPARHRLRQCRQFGAVSQPYRADAECKDGRAAARRPSRGQPHAQRAASGRSRPAGAERAAGRRHGSGRHAHAPRLRQSQL